MQLQTEALHAGYDKDSQSTMAVPIYQTTAYEFRDVEHAANLFALKELGNIYTRLNNPTTDVFEKRFAQLEGGAGGLAGASGMASIFYAIANAAEAGDNIICARQLYGGTLTQASYTLKRFGIQARFFNVQNPSEIEALIDDKTKAIFFETLTNPSIDVADIAAITAIAKKHGILTIVDNTV
ncbi:MAG: aminotransferase class I/II-fold pyridoxal phosphate-dependent enzyme, partial [Sulfuricurvum sp.]